MVKTGLMHFFPLFSLKASKLHSELRDIEVTTCEELERGKSLVQVRYFTLKCLFSPPTPTLLWSFWNDDTVIKVYVINMARQVDSRFYLQRSSNKFKPSSLLHPFGKMPEHVAIINITVQITRWLFSLWYFLACHETTSPRASDVVGWTFLILLHFQHTLFYLSRHIQI